MLENEFCEAVRKAVHFDWDPIGISGVDGEMGEYDSYVPALCHLLNGGASEGEVFEYLWTVETDSIGLDGDPDAIRKFAKSLCRLRSGGDL